MGLLSSVVRAGTKWQLGVNIMLTLVSILDKFLQRAYIPNHEIEGELKEKDRMGVYVFFTTRRHTQPLQVYRLEEFDTLFSYDTTAGKLLAHDP